MVASGVKSILDIAATLERLETARCSGGRLPQRRFPGFYLTATEHRLVWSVGSMRAVAATLPSPPTVGRGGMLLANPLPNKNSSTRPAHDAGPAEALVAVEAGQVNGKQVTPYLLSHLASATGGASVPVNRAIVRHNWRARGRIVVELAARREALTVSCPQRRQEGARQSSSSATS